MVRTTEESLDIHVFPRIYIFYFPGYVLCIITGIPYKVCCKNYGYPVHFLMDNRFDPAKDAANQEKHGLPLSFGDKIFEDDNHLIVPSIREIDGEARFKVIGLVGEKLFIGVFVWRDDMPRFISVRRSNKNEERAYSSSC